MFDFPVAWKRLAFALLLLIGLGTMVAATSLAVDTGIVGDSDVEAELNVNPESGLTSVTRPDNPGPSRQAVSAGEGTVPAPALARKVKLQTESDSRTLWTLQNSLGAFLAEAGILITPDDRVEADGQLIPGSELDDTELPTLIVISRYLRITIDDGLNRQLLRTAAPTVRAALQEAGITLNAADETEPDLDSELVEDAMITVNRSFPLSIHVDGMYIQTRTAHRQIDEVLAQAGIQLAAEDYTVPEAGTVLEANDLIQVVRVTEDFLIEDQSIPYHTLWQATEDLPIDSQAIISEGVPGIRRRRIRVRYENGVEVERKLDVEWVERDPVNEVIGYGTHIDLGVIETPDGPRQYWRVVRMRVTSYTAASSGKRPGEPGYGLTASGLPAGSGVVAVDRSVVPFRSYVYVPGYGIGYAGDTGGGVHGRWIDLGYDEESFVSWSGYADVYYLTPVPPVEDINYLLPNNLP